MSFGKSLNGASSRKAKPRDVERTARAAGACLSRPNARDGSTGRQIGVWSAASACLDTLTTTAAAW